MSQLYTIYCCNCDKHFKSKCILDNFCSEECQNKYYEKPIEDRQLEITTTCPKCKDDWTRKIYKEDFRMYQGLTICHNCNQDEDKIMVSNNKIW